MHRTLVRFVAMACSILLVLLSLQTAVSSNETSPRTTLAVPADKDSLAPLLLIHGGALSPGESEDSAKATLSISFYFERNDTAIIFDIVLDGASATATFHVCSGSTEYYAHDVLSNARLVISSSGARLNILAYRPFGQLAWNSGSEPEYSYTGEYHEASSNLYYLNSRWYDPTTGRFISPDDRLGRLSMPQDQNRYAYVMNNPMKYTDPTGHIVPLAYMFVWFVLAVFMSAEVSGISYLATCGSSCTMNGVYGALAGGAVAGAIGFLTAGLGSGLSLGAEILAVTGGGALANVAAYAIQAKVSGESITWEGVLLSAGIGVGAALLGYGLGKLAGRMLKKPPTGAVLETTSEVATMGDDATGAAANVLPEKQLPSDPFELESMGYKIVEHDFIPDSRGGGYQVIIESPEGYRGVYHSGHIADLPKSTRQPFPDIHFSPHYHLYGPAGKETLNPGARIPRWFR